MASLSPVVRSKEELGSIRSLRRVNSASIAKNKAASDHHSHYDGGVGKKRIASEVNVEELVATHFNVDFRQADAQAKVRGRHNVRVWAFESESLKKVIRLFYLKLYRECPSQLRHFYEVILEDSPCRLYFDLEYLRRFNVELDEEVVVEQFIQTTIAAVAELLELELDRERSFMILDSSTPEKFSSHVIVHLPEGMLFPSNLALKPLVLHICRRMRERHVGVVQADAEGKLAFICDVAVYTRNRNFRLHGSSKCGKAATLTYSKLCRFYGDHVETNAKIFLDSLLVPKDYISFSLVSMPLMLERLNAQSYKNVEDLPIPRHLSHRTAPTRALQLDPEKTASLDASLRQLNSGNSNSPVDELSRGHGPSPFPEVDSFMLNGVLRLLNPRAEIRVWCLIRQKSFAGRSLHYQLNYCRYCHNKGREHRSQNVYWVVDLERFVYYQRCFDVIDCPYYESPRWPLPHDVKAEVTNRVDEAFAAAGL